MLELICIANRPLKVLNPLYQLPKISLKTLETGLHINGFNLSNTDQSLSFNSFKGRY